MPHSCSRCLTALCRGDLPMPKRPEDRVLPHREHRTGNGPAVGDLAGSMPLTPETAASLAGLLARVSDALAHGTREQMTPEQARTAVLDAFDQAVARAGTEQDGISSRDVDVGKLAQSVREQLEWSSQVLSRLDTDTAAALRPMIQDATAAMRLFNQISTYQTFVQVPLQINGQDARGELYVMKRKGRRGRIDASDFTLFLALDTEHLGHVETLAHGAPASGDTAVQGARQGCAGFADRAQAHAV